MASAAREFREYFQKHSIASAEYGDHELALCSNHWATYDCSMPKNGLRGERIGSDTHRFVKLVHCFSS